MEKGAGRHESFFKQKSYRTIGLTYSHARNSGNENCACHGDQSDFLSLFNNHAECNKTPSDQQPVMNASLINIVHLDAELAASCLLVEEHESEIKKLRTENGAIKSELAGMKTRDLSVYQAL